MSQDIIAALTGAGWRHDATTGVCAPGGHTHPLHLLDGPGGVVAEITLGDPARLVLDGLTEAQVIAAVQAVTPAGDVATDDDLTRWCADRLAGFEHWEQAEMAMWPSDRDRDQALIEWTVRTLGNPATDVAEQSMPVLRRLMQRHTEGSDPR